MSRRTPEQIRMLDIGKAAVAIFLLLSLITLIAFRFLTSRPAPTTATPTATVLNVITPTQTKIDTPNITVTETLLPISPPAPTSTFTSLPLPSATSLATPTTIPTSPTLPTTAPTNTRQPTLTSVSTNIVAPTLTPTLIAVGTACPPYGARGQDLGTTYITVYCDTLSNIAERTGVSLKSLIQANPQIPDPNLIFSGSVVIIPTPRK